jgi:SAM-dependent methyltransferase
VHSSIEEFPFEPESFEAIFCYSVVYYADYLKAFKEFFRILKPGGKLYLCTNGIGWYVFNIVKNHNPSKDFNPRWYGFETLLHSLGYYLTKRRIPGKSLSMAPYKTGEMLRQIGFDRVAVLVTEGSQNPEGVEPIALSERTYLGMTKAFEVMAWRGK